jgi:hypothetical protein
MLEAVEEEETVRIGEKVDIADPGLAGRFLLAIAAFFCASIVSLREGFGGPVVLFENPSPGRTATVSAFLGEFGLSGAFSKSLCWVESSVAMILVVVSINALKERPVSLRICLGWPDLSKCPKSRSHIFSHSRISICESLLDALLDQFKTSSMFNMALVMCFFLQQGL